MKRFSIILALLALLLLPQGAFAQGATTTVAAGDLEVSGWIPYWAVTQGTRDARKHLDVLTELNPFSYVAQSDGTIKDLAKMNSSAWTRLIRDARREGVRVVPTIMWSDTTAIHTILSDSKKRAAHVKRIADLVKRERYDGIDIDYEGKLADTNVHFSAFITELNAVLGEKMLVCTIEARTPPDSLYTKVPATLEYANDYAVLNTNCDRVRIMTYDQQRADLKLNSSRAGSPYYPVADLAWVRKVMEFAAKDISKDKLILSTATYGRELSVTVAPNWFKSYTQLWSVSDEYARETAEEYKVVPNRNAGGEMSFTYIPEESGFTLPTSATAPAGTLSGNQVAARALAYANATGKEVKFNLVWWSDGAAIAEKVALAKELGVRGVAIFKVDGGEDMTLWDAFAK